MSKGRYWSAGVVALMALAAACGGAAAPTATSTRAPAASTTAPAAAPTTVPATIVASPTQQPGATLVPTAAPAPTRVAVQSRGRVVMALSLYDDDETDISKYRSGNVKPLYMNMNDNLVARDEEGKWYGSLAESWTAGPDKWVFKVKKGVKFHDGTTMKASDIKFTIDRELVEPLYVFRGELAANISRVDAPDDTTLVINTKQPYPLWFFRAESSSAALPAAYYTRVGGDEFAKKPIGVGAYKFVSRDIAVSTKLTAFSDYHRGAAQVRDVVLIPIREPATKLAMLKTGEADIVDALTGPQAMELRNTPDLRVIVSRNTGTINLGFFDLINAPDNEKKPARNIKVRQAIAYAIDRQTIVDKIYAGSAEVAATAWNPATPGLNLDVKPWPYDPNKAKQLMKEAGFPNGFDIDFPVRVAANQALIQAIQAYLKEIDIRVKIVVMETSTWITQRTQLKLRGLTEEAGSNVPRGLPDPEQPIFTYYLGPYRLWEDPRLQEIYNRLHVEVDVDRRGKIASEADELLRGEFINIPLVHVYTLFGVGKRIDVTPTKGFSQIDEARRIAWRPGY